MNGKEWMRSGLIILVLFVLAMLVAQGRRNCEVPGSTWVPCVFGNPLPKTLSSFRISERRASGN